MEVNRLYRICGGHDQTCKYQPPTLVPSGQEPLKATEQNVCVGGYANTFNAVFPVLPKHLEFPCRNIDFIVINKWLCSQRNAKNKATELIDIVDHLTVSSV